MPIPDTSGRTLEDYARPSVAVDTAVLTVPPGGPLAVLLTRTNDAVRGKPGAADQWVLPGTFLHRGERLADAALRALDVKAGATGLRPRQLHVFDAPGRDSRGWVLTVAHLDVVPADRLSLNDRSRLVPIDELPELQFDHNDVVAAAVAALRAEYRRAPDPAGLLAADAPDAPGPHDVHRASEPPGAFTIFELRRLHEAVLGERQSRDAFRRLMLPQLESTGMLRRGARGKPAELWVRS